MRARTVALIGGVVLASVLAVGAGLLEAAPARVMVCPASDRTVARTTLPAAIRTLVPSGTTGVLLCRYRGLGSLAKRWRLLGSRTLRAASKVGLLRAQLNGLPRAVGVIACPSDDGSKIIAYFHYPGASDDVVSIGTSGCAPVSNGHVHRTASLASGVKLRQELEALTG
jgi:hypothetical protein